MKYRTPLAIFAFVFIFFSNAFTQKNFEKDFFSHFPREVIGAEHRSMQSPNTGNYDVTYCRLDLNVDPNVYFLDGKATVQFIPTKAGVRNIYFDFTTGLEVTDVNFEESSMNFTQIQGDELMIKFPEDLEEGAVEEVVIEYSGQPGSSGFGSFATGMQCEGEVPAMWTLSEPYGAKHWWPCKQTLNDKYDSIDMVITTPEMYRAASNGLLVEELENGDGTKTYHWSHRYAIPAYLVAFAVSEYKVYSDYVPLENGDQLEVLNYVFPCNEDYARDRTPYTVPVMQFFREKFGEYPYIEEKYGHCNFGWGGGMEHSTMSFMGGFSNLLIAHELAHQWFGDKITCGSWQDIWLNEGFATYLEGLSNEFTDNFSGWENWKANNQWRATNSPDGSVFVDDTTSVNRIFNGNLSYSKGAYLLHMLRWMMGDEDFFKAINDYIHDPELIYGYARTPDLQKHLETVSGMDLEEFFNDWFYGRGYPTYQIVWERTDDGVWLKVNQAQSHASVDFFDVPIPVQIQGVIMDTTVVVNPGYSGEYFKVELDWLPVKVKFDPERWICARNEVITAVDDPQLDDLIIYPNPTDDWLVIEHQEGNEFELSIYDAFGRKTFDADRNDLKNGYLKVDVSDYVPGIYLVNVKSGQQGESYPVVIE